jgi:hypothetical protein
MAARIILYQIPHSYKDQLWGMLDTKFASIRFGL